MRIPVRRQFGGLLRLARYKEYTYFVTITTLLGVAAGHGEFGWRLLCVLAANWLGVGFIFMINDVEDAPEDALNPAKAQRNPVSAGDLSEATAERLSTVVMLASALLFGLLGSWPFIIGGTCLIIGHLYSWRRVRLKTIPGVDLISHCLMLAALQFLAAQFTFEPGYLGPWVFPLVMAISISLYGELFNEIRDYEGDVRAGIRHTATVLGPRVTHVLMWVLLVIGGFSAVAAGVSGFIPPWVLLIMLVAAVILLARPVLRARHSRSMVELQEPFQKPVELSAAVALLLWFVIPWAGKMLPWASQALWALLR